MFPIMEFDHDPRALIEPTQVIRPLERMPSRCVLCFFSEVLAELEGASTLCHQVSEMGKHPVWAVSCAGQEVAVCHPGVGAPLAAGMLEELIARGCRQFVACGGAGSLRPESQAGGMVVVTGAVRDEGTSYHYLPPARIVEAHPVAVTALRRALQSTPYQEGLSWTTDAIYRETRSRIARRRDEGCLTVEMEAAALLAVAQFRQVPLGVLLYHGDDVSGDQWDSRAWNRRTRVREEVFQMALRAVLAI